MFQLFTALLASTILIAQGWAASPGERALPAEDQQAAELYARQLANLVGIISDQYVREVPTATIYESAVIALYEAARQPLPSGLLLDLKKAENPADQLQIVALVRQTRLMSRTGGEPGSYGKHQRSAQCPRPLLRSGGRA